MRGKIMRARMLHGIWRTSLLACALFLAAPGAGAQGSRKQDIVLNRFGQPVAGATVTVCTAGATGTPCSPLATIYSNVALTTVQANPFTTDGLGNYNFYAAPGRYQIQFSGAGLTTTTIPDVILPCDPSNCSASSINVTNGISAFSLSLSGNLAVSGSVTTGSLIPTSLSTPQAGAAPAQVGPQWYPGTTTGVVTPPATAPSVFVDATVSGSIGTTTYYYEIVYRNLNGRTTPSPVTTFAAPSGATNAIDCRPAAADYTWRSGGFEYECYVGTSATGPFYLQTPYTNATHTTAHYVPGDAVYQSFTFSGTTAPTTNTATIDPLQVALNATCNYTANTCAGMLVVPAATTTLTTPLVVSNQQKIIGASNVRTDQTQSLITSTFADLSIATVMAMGPVGNGWSIEGLAIQNTATGGNGLMLMGSGQGLQNQNTAVRNSSITARSNNGTGCAVLIQGVFYNLDFDNVYLRGDKASVCAQYASGSEWTFKGSRWDDNVSALVSVRGYTDRDRLVNYTGFPAAVSFVNFYNMFTESGTGIVFDAVGLDLHFTNSFTADAAASPGTLAVIQIGCDIYCATGNGGSVGMGLSMKDSGLAGSANFTQAVYVASNNLNLIGPIVLQNSQVRGNINLNSFNSPAGVFVYGSSDLCLDTSCQAGAPQITNRPATGLTTSYGLAAKGALDGSGNPDYLSTLGRYMIQYPADNWGKRRRWFFDIATDNNYCLNPPGTDTVNATAQADICVDNLGNSTFRNALTWGGGNKISKVLQAQTALTFGAIAAQTCGNQTVALTGAATTNGAFASPNYAVEAGLSWSAFVSAANTVTVRACNVTIASITPAAASNWRVWVVQE